MWRFLEIADLPEGSEVLVAAYNYYVVVRVLMQRGLRPVFVDIDRETLSMDPDDLRRKLSRSSSLVVVTHMFGVPADMAAIVRICEQHGVALFEDCAHGVGTIAHGRHVGCFGDGALFSFGPFKSVTCFGGGMLALRAARSEPGPATVRLSWIARVRHFANMLVALGTGPRLYGRTLHPIARFARRLAERGSRPLRDLVAPAKDVADYEFGIGDYPPFRGFMIDMLRLQLARLPGEIDRRRAAIAKMKHAIEANPQVQLLDEDKHGLANGSYFGVYVPDAEDFCKFMLSKGVEVSPQEFYDCSRLAQFAAHASECPQAAYASRHLVRLPSYSTLRPEDLARIAGAANQYFAGAGQRRDARGVTTASSRVA